jgi:2-methylisocitrate lyase-like PEP mutase family enzyme
LLAVAAEWQRERLLDQPLRRVLVTAPALDHRTRATAFRDLHQPGQPLVLVNVWDLGSAGIVAKAGAPALATSSWAVAAAANREDGEQVPLDDVVALVASLSANFPVPVTVDLETGYGRTPTEVGATVRRAVRAGAVGCNLEDRDPEGSGLRDPVDQAARYRSAREACDQLDVPAFVNARTDVFLLDPDAGGDGVREVERRAHAYADAGADGIFVPGLRDLALVRDLVTRSPLPVNIMVDTPDGLADLALAGVARISFGAAPYAAAATALAATAATAHEAVTRRGG